MRAAERLDLNIHIKQAPLKRSVAREHHGVLDGDKMESGGEFEVLFTSETLSQ